VVDESGSVSGIVFVVTKVGLLVRVSDRFGERSELFGEGRHYVCVDWVSIEGECYGRRRKRGGAALIRHIESNQPQIRCGKALMSSPS
jgi:hypothetical protein